MDQMQILLREDSYPSIFQSTAALINIIKDHHYPYITVFLLHNGYIFIILYLIFINSIAPSIQFFFKLYIYYFLVITCFVYNALAILYVNIN